MSPLLIEGRNGVATALLEIILKKNMEGMSIHRADVMERKTQRNAKGGTPW